MSAETNDHALPSIDRWLARLSGKSESTRDCYGRDVRQVADIVGKTLNRPALASDIISLDTEWLEGMTRNWLARRHAPATVRRRLVSLRRYGRDLADSEGLVGPLLHARFPVIDVPVLERVSDHAMTGLAENVDPAMAWTEARDLAILSLIVERGVSTGELARMQRQHLALDLLLVTSPRGSTRFVQLPESVVDQINVYWAQCPRPHDASGPLWLNARGGALSVRSIQMMFRRRRSQASLPPGVAAGTYRRSYIRALARSGLSVEQIAAKIGIGTPTVLFHLQGS